MNRGTDMMPQPIQKHRDARILRYVVCLIVAPLFLVAYHRGSFSSSLTTLIATLVVLLIVWFLLASWRLSASLTNLKTFAKLLHSEIRRPFLGLPFYYLVEGRWQEWRVRVKFFTAALQATEPRDVGISIEPKIALGAGKKLPSLPTTELTAVSGQRVYYEPPETHPLRRTEFNTRRFADEEVLSILEELTRAAKRVEEAKCSG